MKFKNEELHVVIFYVEKSNVYAFIAKEDIHKYVFQIQRGISIVGMLC